jgi:hypothetical protein
VSFNIGSESDIGQVSIVVSNYGGHTPEQLADMAIKSILSVRGDPPAAVKAQLVAFHDRLKGVLIELVQTAQHHERLNIVGKLLKENRPDLARIIKEL